MKPWTPSIDPATIPDSVLKSEWGKRTAAKRKFPSGGRNGGRPMCTCGSCGACLKRAKIKAK